MTKNPFDRGYGEPKIVRELQVIQRDRDDLAPWYVKLHESQSALSGDDLKYQPCAFTPEYALVEQDDPENRRLVSECRAQGEIVQVLYSVRGRVGAEDDELLGDTYFKEDAEKLVRLLSFDDGVAHCREQSRRHLSQDAREFMALHRQGFLFRAFIPHDADFICVRLDRTPWTDEHLLDAAMITAAGVRTVHEAAGMPSEFADLLQLAGEAGVRYLIFTPEAPVLEGLPVYD
jgi:hypothetical protein